MSTEVQLTGRFVAALSYSATEHFDDPRKSQDEDPWAPSPYIGHPLAVASLVLEHGGSEDQAIAALLHDVAEDKGGQEALDKIEILFGPDVARMVKQCSDALPSLGEEKEEWKPRKKRYIDSLGDKDADALLVSCADKLHNSRATLSDHRRLGDTVYLRFNIAEGSAARGRKYTLWYLSSLSDAFLELLADDEQARHLAEELSRVVKKLEARGPDADTDSGA